MVYYTTVLYYYYYYLLKYLLYEINYYPANTTQYLDFISFVELTLPT